MLDHAHCELTLGANKKEVECERMELNQALNTPPKGSESWQLLGASKGANKNWWGWILFCEMASQLKLRRITGYLG